MYIVYTSFFVLCSDQKTTSQEPVPEYFYYKFYRQIKCRSRLPEEWQLIDEADKGHLEEGDRCRQLYLKLVTVLNRLDGRCRECQGRKHAWCKGCKLCWCRRCAHETGECIVCGQAWGRQREADGNAHSGSGNGKRTRKRRAPMSSARNMHGLGRTFVEEVLDVREVQSSTEEETAKGHHLQFKCQIRGWTQGARAQMRTYLLSLTDVALRQYLVHSNGSILVHFARTMWRTISPRYGEVGGMQYVMKSRTWSVACVQNGYWKVNPSRRFETIPITRRVRHALQEGPETPNVELEPHQRQKLRQEGQKAGLYESLNDTPTMWKYGVPMKR